MPGFAVDGLIQLRRIRRMFTDPSLQQGKESVASGETYSAGSNESLQMATESPLEEEGEEGEVAGDEVGKDLKDLITVGTNEGPSWHDDSEAAGKTNALDGFLVLARAAPVPDRAAF